MDIDKFSNSRIGRVAIPAVLYLWYCATAQDPLMILITMPSFFAVCYFLTRNRSRYITYLDVLNFIFFLFYVISPLQSIDHGQFSQTLYVANFGIHYNNIITAQAIFFLFYVPFMIIMNRSYHSTSSISIRLGNISQTALFIILLLSFAAYIVASGGIGNLLSARRLKDDVDSGVLLLPARAALTAAALIILASYRGQRATLWGAIAAAISLLALLIAINPFNSPRQFLFAAWFPIIYVLTKGRLKAFHMQAFFIGAILVLMPIFSAVGRIGTSFSAAVAAYREQAALLLTTPYSDVYYLLVITAKWFETEPLNYGNKTLGLLFFFIPRSFWTEKPTLTGLDIGEFLYVQGISGTDNLSFFIGGDFYADFGLVGVLLGAILTGFVISFAILSKSIRIGGYDIKRLLFMGALPILIRGPVGANVGLLFCQLLFTALLVVALLQFPGIKVRSSLLRADRGRARKPPSPRSEPYVRS